MQWLVRRESFAWKHIYKHEAIAITNSTTYDLDDDCIRIQFVIEPVGFGTKNN